MDNEVIFSIINMAIWPLMLIFFYFVGKSVERRHLRNLAEQEAALSHIVVHQLKNLPAGWAVTAEPALVCGSVVLAIDYFRSFKSMLKKIIGGRLGEYERLVERGRREAIVRMKQLAADQGYNVVWNLRIETSMMMDGRKSSSSVEVYAYGTGMYVQSGR